MMWTKLTENTAVSGSFANSSDLFVELGLDPICLTP